MPNDPISERAKQAAEQIAVKFISGRDFADYEPRIASIIASHITAACEPAVKALHTARAALMPMADHPIASNAIDEIDKALALYRRES